MKKTLIALAALASTAAFAQSTVTLSGVVDTGIQKTASGAALSMVASRNGTSNWTLAGSEDLGGGLKANFKISTAFNSDDGTTTANLGASPLGNNDMWVGLSGGFGDVKLGRSVNPVFSHALTANSTKGVTGYAAVGSTLDSLNVYVPNQVLYTSPTFSGFTVTASYAPSETQVGGVTQKAHTGLAVRYADGPLNVTLANANELTNSAAISAYKPKNVTQIGAAYDFGVARVLFTWQDDANNAADQDTAWVLGMTAPVGPGTLWAQYGIAEAPGTDSKIFSLGYKYPLSKRTQVYVNLGNRNTAAAGFQAAQTKGTGYGFGLQHNF